MKIFRPDLQKDRVLEITPAIAESLQAKAILLDVDNTLSTHGAQTPLAGAVEWAHRMVEAGFRVIIVSNNSQKRVQPFAAKFDLPFITRAAKPLPFGYLRAAHKLRIPAKNCLVVGDQIFTDIWGANTVGMRSVLLTPIQPETGRSFTVRRKLERPLREKYSALQARAE